MDQLEIDPERDKLSLGIDADRQSDDRYDGARAYGKGNDERENAFKRSNHERACNGNRDRCKSRAAVL